MTYKQFLKIVGGKCIICRQKLILDSERELCECPNKKHDHAFTALINEFNQIFQIYINPPNFVATLHIQIRILEFFGFNDDNSFKIDIDPISILKLRGEAVQQKFQLILNFS